MRRLVPGAGGGHTAAVPAARPASAAGGRGAQAVVEVTLLASASSS